MRDLDRPCARSLPNLRQPESPDCPASPRVPNVSLTPATPRKTYSLTSCPQSCPHAVHEHGTPCAKVTAHRTGQAIDREMFAPREVRGLLREGVPAHKEHGLPARPATLAPTEGRPQQKSHRSLEIHSKPRAG